MDLSNVQAVYHEMVVQTMCLVVEKVWEKNQFYDELLSLKLRKVEGSPVSYWDLRALFLWVLDDFQICEPENVISEAFIED